MKKEERIIEKNDSYYNELENVVDFLQEENLYIKKEEHRIIFIDQENQE